MAIDPRIAMSGRHPNYFGSYQQGKQNRLANLMLESRGKAYEAQAEQANAQGQQIAHVNELAKRAVSGDSQANNLLLALDPSRAKGLQESRQAQLEWSHKQEAQGALRAQLTLRNGDAEGAVQILSQLPESRARNQTLEMLSQGNTEQAMQGLDAVVESATRSGLLDAGPQQPSSVREYEYAKGQGFKGSYQDWSTQQGKARGTNISLNVSNGSMPLTKKGEGAVETEQLNSQDMLARIDGIQRSYKPEYQQVPYRVGAWFDSVRNKFGGDLSGDERRDLADFSKFKRRALENLNLYIRQLSGAAMTESEAQRLKPTMPNAGTGLTDGDSPTEFQAKLNDVAGTLKASLRRYETLRQEGIPLTQKTAEQYPLSAFMGDEGADREKTYVAPDAPDAGSYSAADLERAAEAEGMSVDEVIEALGLEAQ